MKPRCCTQFEDCYFSKCNFLTLFRFLLESNNEVSLLPRIEQKRKLDEKELADPNFCETDFFKTRKSLFTRRMQRRIHCCATPLVCTTTKRSSVSVEPCFEVFPAKVPAFCWSNSRHRSSLERPAPSERVSILLLHTTHVFLRCFLPSPPSNNQLSKPLNPEILFLKESWFPTKFLRT